MARPILALTSGFDSRRADLAPQLIRLVARGRHVRIWGSRDYFCTVRPKILAQISPRRIVCVVAIDDAHVAWINSVLADGAQLECQRLGGGCHTRIVKSSAMVQLIAATRRP